MANFSILLAPSEKSQEGGNPFVPDMFDYRTPNTFNYFNELNIERRKVIGAVQESIEAGNRLETLFATRGEDLEQVTRINQEIYDAPLMAALDRFSPGIMYEAMDFQGLPTGAQRRLLENGIILSGFFGLLRPDDLVPDHRLPMESNVPGVGALTDFWRPILSPVLNRTIKGAFVWNMLPDSHLAAWEDDHGYAQCVRVRFYDEKKGARQAARSNLAPITGKLVNFIVREAVDNLDALLEWKHPDGYAYDADASTENEATKEIEIAFVKRA